MNQRAGQSDKESALRKYFMQPPPKPSPGCLAIGFLIVGGIMFLVCLGGLAGSNASEGVPPLIGALILLGIGSAIIYSKNSAYKNRLQEGEPNPMTLR